MDNQENLVENNFLYDEVSSKKPFPKYIILFIISFISLIIGAFMYYRSLYSSESLEKYMKEYGLDYFEENMSINDSTHQNIVSLDMLENADKKYNLKYFKGCKKQTTYAKIITNSANEIKKIEVELNC